MYDNIYYMPSEFKVDDYSENKAHVPYMRVDFEHYW